MTKLDSTEAFRYVWYGWRFLGIHPFETHKTLYKIYSVFVSFAITFLATFQLVIQAFFVESFAQLMRNMSTSIELTCCSLKTAVVFIFRNKLLQSHEYLKKLDERAEQHPIDRKRMEEVITNCRRIFFIFKVLFWMTLGSYAVAGLLTGRLVFEGWLPFDWKSSRKLYIIAFSYQWFNSCFQCIMNLTTDVYAVLYTYVLLGHMQCLARRISSIGHDNGVKSSKENYEELVRCVNDHRNTLGYFQCLSPVISGTIFVQILVTAFVVCMTVICVIIYTQSLAFLMMTFTYLLAVLGEVLPCCFVVSEVMQASSYLTTAIYSCNWMDQDLKFRKAVVIFMQRTQKPNIINAGNIIPISLPTFASLIRVTFSLFTLLSSL